MAVKHLAIVKREKCKSRDCGQGCIKYCPVNRSGHQCIELDEKGVAVISEVLCIGCNICVKKCPFDAINIIRLPAELEKDYSHRYGENQFALYRLPIPRPGMVTGLVGQNGAGKSTSLKILSGEMQPNLGRWDNPPEWDEIIRYYRGSELQNYFTKLKEGNLKVVAKPQAVDKIPQVFKGTVKELLSQVDERNALEEIKKEFDLDAVWDREISVLSGGELQRVAIAATIARKADYYFFDEPSSYLDVRERLRAARQIRRIVDEESEKGVVAVEHDLAVLDYLSDQVCLYYGEAGSYGVVTFPMGVREGINAFLDGFIPSENMRFRSEPISFKKALTAESKTSGRVALEYGQIKHKLGDFALSVDGGTVNRGEVIGILGPNGIGKTTFVKILARQIEPDELEFPIQKIKKITNAEKEGEEEEEELTISYKPQYIPLKGEQTVRELLMKINAGALTNSFYKSELLNPLHLPNLYEKRLDQLSGGELQKVAITAALLKDADIYLFDEPSAFISSEDRVIVAKTIRKIVNAKDAVAFIVEHDLMLQAYLSDRIIVFSGKPGIQGHASRPMTVQHGMNTFLESLGITFRKDQTSGRPRVNKPGSRLDKEQKAKGNYFYVK